MTYLSSPSLFLKLLSKYRIFLLLIFIFQDANSLAYYNIMPGTVLNLQLKERGGRKK